MHFLRSLFDLLPDVAGILLAALSLSLIFLPKELRVLEEPKWKWLRWTLAAIFAGVGIGGLASNAIQKAEDKKDRASLQGDVARLKDDLTAVKNKVGEKYDASVGLLSINPLNLGQEMTAGKSIQFNIGYLVLANTAKNFKAYQEMFSERGLRTDEQTRRSHAKFMARAAQSLDFKGEDRVVGTGAFKTVELKLSGTEITEVMNAKRIIYIMGRVEWNNPSGSESHFDTCKWMEKPAMKYLTVEMTTWHDCGL